MSTNTEHKSFQEIQLEAALSRLQEQAAERRKVAQIVLGPNSQSRRRVGEIVKLGDDYIAEVRDGKQPATWTTVVNGKADSWLFHSQEEAVLYLIARRHSGDDPNSAPNAAFYAGRVLGIPEAGE
jgi:hypothetical protein